MIWFLVDIAGALGTAPTPEPSRTGLALQPLPIETLDELVALLKELQIVLSDEDPPIAVHFESDKPLRASIVNLTLPADGSVAIALSVNIRDGDPAAWSRRSAE
ncbi:MAG: hypothetical protein FD152_3440 [Xanthobacteraceae bacterium]|nr:MAG: hypothetical protein FD152_3440 [Xanthobacteraceae bacterium]